MMAAVTRLLAIAGCGEVGGAERQAPQPVVVVLGAAQVQGEGLVEQAEPGECLSSPSMAWVVGAPPCSAISASKPPAVI
jgi:hypothetical protein